jgi:hypothetical protein
VHQGSSVFQTLDLPAILRGRRNTLQEVVTTGGAGSTGVKPKYRKRVEANCAALNKKLGRHGENRFGNLVDARR